MGGVQKSYTRTDPGSKNRLLGQTQNTERSKSKCYASIVPVDCRALVL